MNDYKLPERELSGEDNLKGTYKVTLLVNIDETDQMDIGDLHASIAEGLKDSPILTKISRMDLEKTNKKGEDITSDKSFEIGDVVVVKEDVKIEADIESHNGLYVIGSKEPKAEKLDTVTINIPAGFEARVNQVYGDKVELIEFDSPLYVPMRNEHTSESEDVLVNLYSIIFANKYIERLGENE